MTLLEIIMLIIGAAIVIISSLIINSPDKKSKENSYDSNATKQYSDSLSSASEEIINKTEEYLSKLSNEKIMAVSEYSDQVLEKIDRNHEEAVFLYNMLTHKENELKEVLREYNESQRRARELLTKKVEDGSYDINSANINIQSRENTGSFYEEQNGSQPDSINNINNEEILNLYSQGMSVLEISKQLGIGQGEVKLIIDLFSR